MSLRRTVPPLLCSPLAAAVTELCPNHEPLVLHLWHRPDKLECHLTASMDYSSGITDYGAGDSMVADMNGACDLRIGEPIHFSTGQFAGRTVRAELIEVQKAELGRK